MYEDDKSPGGGADVPDEIYYHQSDKVKSMESLSFIFKLDNNIFHDLIGNNLDMILVSARFRDLLDHYKLNAPPYKWLNATVESQNGKVRFEYYLMIFLEKPDILDLDNTRFVNNSLLHAAFSYSKISRYSFVPEPRVLERTLIVSEEVKNHIMAAKITGVVFDKTRIIFDD